MLEENVQDDEDDESVQCQSAQASLSESEIRQTEIDPEEILQKIDLSGTTEWNSTQQEEAYNLICEYTCILSQNDLDLGKTSIVKHSIKLTDPTPFKEHYKCIPLGMYEEVKADIQEMLDIGAIHPSNSPWASAVVFVWKKDGKFPNCLCGISTRQLELLLWRAGPTAQHTQDSRIFFIQLNYVYNRKE